MTTVRLKINYLCVCICHTAQVLMQTQLLCGNTVLTRAITAVCLLRCLARNRLKYSVLHLCKFARQAVFSHVTCVAELMQVTAGWLSVSAQIHFWHVWQAVTATLITHTSLLSHC
jgi:hypothetical protein